MTNSSQLFGLVLGGGRSSRMGRDKANIDYHGKPQIEFLFELLSQCCDDVFFSCKKNSGIPQRLHPMEDQFSIDSPLNGILTAFSLRPDVAWLSVPVDMPNVNLPAIKYLIDHRDPSKIATCYYDSDGKCPEPLLTLWEQSAGILLKDFFHTGEFSPRSFLMKHPINILTAPDPKILININSPDELNRFR
jgi:molybdenum cofactor guanylyltransferase